MPPVVRYDARPRVRARHPALICFCALSSSRARSFTREARTQAASRRIAASSTPSLVIINRIAGSASRSSRLGSSFLVKRPSAQRKGM
jgi:hypothetical protein